MRPRWASSIKSDIDLVVVQRLEHGLRPKVYSSWERREAVARLTARGFSQTMIAQIMNIQPRQVYRDLLFGISNNDPRCRLPGRGRCIDRISA